MEGKYVQTRQGNNFALLSLKQTINLLILLFLIIGAYFINQGGLQFKLLKLLFALIIILFLLLILLFKKRKEILQAKITNYFKIK